MRKHSRYTATVAAMGMLAIACSSCSRADRKNALLEQANRYYDAGEYDQAEIEYKNVLQKDGMNTDAIARLGMLYHEQGRETRAFAFLLKTKELQPDNLESRLKLGRAFLTAGRPKEARDEAIFILERRPQDAQAPILLVDAAADAKEREEARQRLLGLPAPAPESAPVLVALGHLELRQNRVKEAETALKRALSLDPKSVPAHTALGALHWSQKDLPAADAALKQAADLSPVRSPQRLHYARFKIQTGDLSSGKRLLDEISRATPDYLPVWVWLAEIAAIEKKFEESEAFLTKALSRDPMHPEALLLNARVKLAKGETDKAVAELEKLQMNFPTSTPVAYQLGLALAAKGETARAISQFTQVISAAPQMAEAGLALAELHIRKRDFGVAIASLRQLVQDRPDLPKARVLLAEALHGQGDLDGALAIYRKLEEQFPKDPQPTFRSGLLLAQQNKTDEARKAFTRVNELQPSYLPAIEQLVNMDLRDKQFAAARQRLDREIAKNAGSPEPHVLLAKVSLAQSDIPAAEASLKKAIELQPESAVAQFMLARLYVGSNRHEQALEGLQQIVTQNPKNIGALLLTSIIHDERKNHAAARDSYEKVLAVDAKNGLALNNLAYLYSEHFGRLDEALELAQRARVQLPQEPRAADTLGWILYQKKQYAQALTLLQESAAQLPTAAEVQYHLGCAHYMLGDDEPARIALQRALELNASFAGADEARQRLFVLKLDPAKAGADARTALEKQLAERPGDPVALVRLAHVYEHAGQADKAMRSYDAAVQANPRNARALIGIARLHAAKNQLAKALESAKAARALSPNDPVITHTLGRLAYQTGDHGWAASLLQDASKQQPDNPEVLFDWAEAAYSVGRVPDAESGMRRALQAGPSFSRAPEAQRFLDLLPLSADPARAMAEAAKVEQALKANSASLPALMADALIRERSDASAAKQSYEKLLRGFPEFSPAQRQLTLLYAANPDDSQKASALATKARRAFPNDPDVARAVGIIAYRQGDFARAASLLQETANRRTADGELMYYLGMAQSRLNKRAESKKALKRALELGLKDNLAAEARKSLAGSE